MKQEGIFRITGEISSLKICISPRFVFLIIYIIIFHELCLMMNGCLSSDWDPSLHLVFISFPLSLGFVASPRTFVK